MRKEWGFTLGMLMFVRQGQTCFWFEEGKGLFYDTSWGARVDGWWWWWVIRLRGSSRKR